MDSRINTRIDPQLKTNASIVFHRLGISESEAIRMFYAQVHLHQGLPFDVRIPNAETIAALEEAKNPNAGTRFKDTKALFASWDDL
jgi:DNA-damage-inducible protein J